MTSQSVVPKKKRGPAPTGKGTQVQVRLQPDLLEILDRFAAEVGHTRPEALRRAFSQWADSTGLAPHHPRLREHPVMVMLRADIMKAATEATGEQRIDDAVNVILASYLREKGYLPK